MSSIFRRPLVAILCSTATVAFGATPSLPIEVGDTWAYQQVSTANGKREMATPEFSVMFENKDGNLVLGVANAAQASGQRVYHPLGPIRKGICVFDLVGRDTLGLDDTCHADLSPGRSWDTDKSDSVSRVEQRFKVLGSEEVTVPAGRYAATKIEGVRTVTEVAYPGVPAPDGYVKISRTTYWYVPQLNAMAKVERETATPAGKVLFRMSEELKEFRRK